MYIDNREDTVEYLIFEDRKMYDAMDEESRAQFKPNPDKWIKLYDKIFSVDFVSESKPFIEIPFTLIGWK